MKESPPPQGPGRVQEWILWYLIERESAGKTTKGNDVFWPQDIEPLVGLGLVSITQTHCVPSLQKTISASTVISLTETGRRYFER
jgi:hypothetical protein